MEQRLPLLAGGSRSAPERQRTLRATMAWSYELLAAEEQATFARFAVFSGGCTLEAAEEICVADVENLEEKIWEQLIATPPVRGRSMTTVTVENARILLSAWEVAAFISDSGQDSEDLRRLMRTASTCGCHS